jgi:hypothetical protein
MFVFVGYLFRSVLFCFMGSSCWIVILIFVVARRFPTSPLRNRDFFDLCLLFPILPACRDDASSYCAAMTIWREFDRIVIVYFVFLF